MQVPSIALSVIAVVAAFSLVTVIASEFITMLRPKTKDFRPVVYP